MDRGEECVYVCGGLDGVGGGESMRDPDKRRGYRVGGLKDSIWCCY